MNVGYGIMSKEEPEINFCKDFVDKISDKKGFENKIRYLLEDFFFNEGWASHTNPKNGKEGYSHQYTYNYDTIRHFIEDMVRFSVREFKIAQQGSLIKPISGKYPSKKETDSRVIMVKCQNCKLNEVAVIKDQPYFGIICGECSKKNTIYTTK